MIITLYRRGLLKIYASFCVINISFCVVLTFRFTDYISKPLLNFEPATVAPDINACMDALIAIFCFYFVLFNSFSTLVLVPCLLNR